MSGSRTTPADVRIRAKLVDQPNGCQLWTGVIDAQGYGRIGYRGRRSTPLQQAVYREFVGPIPDGHTVDHLCHTRDETCAGGRTCLHRRCGNPAHLEAVTSAENAARGRSPWAVNARKTCCPEGHEYTDANTYRNGGRRYCIACYTALHGKPPVRVAS